MPSRTPAVLRDLRTRWPVGVLSCALSAVVVLTAVLGPLLARSISTSTLLEAVATAGEDGTALTLFLDRTGVDDGSAAAAVSAALRPTEEGRASALWRAPQFWAESTENLAWAPQPRTEAPEQVSRVRAAPGCEGLVLVSGTCPSRSGQVLLSSVDARRDRLGVGSVLAFRLQGAPERRLVVTGSYDPDRADAPLSRPGTVAGTAAGVTADPLVLSDAQLARLPLTLRQTGRVLLRPGLRPAEEPVARASIVAVNDALQEQAVPITLATRVVDLLDTARSRAEAARVLVAVDAVQALALAAFALAVVLQRLARARRAEWGVGRLRGVPRTRWLASIYTEPALALVAGVPLGAVAAVLLARRAVARTLWPGTGVEVWRTPVVLAAAGAGLASLVVLVAVSLPSLQRPLVELIQQRAESRRTGVVSAAAQAAVVLLAAATLYELRFGGVLGTRGSQLGLLAPAVAALALAVVAVRVAVLVVRRVTTRPARGLAALVVGRQAARAPSALNPAVAVAVGVALAVFATQVLALSLRNQDLRADAAVGAGTVLRVAVPSGLDLLTAVDRADPGGRSAMAVQERAAAADAGTSRIVAVDSARFAAVTVGSPAWWGTPDVAAALRPATRPAIELRGTRVAVRVADVLVAPGPVSIAGTPPADPVLTLTVDTGTRWATVLLGPLSAAPRLRAALPCPQGCRLVGLGWVSPSGAPYTASLTVTGIATDREPDALSATALGAAGAWQTRVGVLDSPQPVAQAVPQPGGGGLAVRVVDQAGGNPALVTPTSTTDPLPALLAPGTNPDPFPGIADAVFGQGLDGRPQLLRVVGRAAVLPRALDDGVLVDLSTAQQLSDPAEDSTSDEVWLAPGASPAVERALTAAGLRITAREDLAATRRALRQEPSTSAAAVAAYLGYAGLLLTLLTVAAARVADAARRRGDWRSLLEGGLGAAAIRRLVLLEVAVPPLLGTLLGVVAGVGTVALAAPRLPLVDLTRPGPPLDLRLSWPPVAALGLGVAVAVVLLAAVAAVLETRQATGGRP